MRRTILIATTAVGASPFWMTPALMWTYDMSRPDAWFHVATVIALVWFPLWVVLGLLLASWAEAA
jgi:hypothetical protein